MPWDASSFAARHNHGLDHAQAAHAARIANAILARGAPEGIAIATANKRVEKRDLGGLVQSEPMSPQYQAMAQRYASMPIEKLQELAAMMGGSPQGHVIQTVLRQKQMMPQVQPPPQAPQEQRRGGPTRAMGGVMSPSMATPWWTRSEARGEDSGFLHGVSSGRADAVSTTAPAGSYIIPADVVAGLGDGNSLAGARVMDEIVRSGPYGTPQPRMGHGRGPPTPPRWASTMEQISKGGRVDGGGETPVRLSHGEYVVSPEQATMLGGGNLKRGHRVLDHFVLLQRKKNIGKLKKLPGPVKS